MIVMNDQVNSPVLEKKLFAIYILHSPPRPVDQQIDTIFHL